MAAANITTTTTTTTPAYTIPEIKDLGASLENVLLITTIIMAVIAVCYIAFSRWRSKREQEENAERQRRELLAQQEEAARQAALQPPPVYLPPAESEESGQSADSVGSSRDTLPGNLSDSSLKSGDESSVDSVVSVNTEKSMSDMSLKSGDESSVDSVVSVNKEKSMSDMSVKSVENLEVSANSLASVESGRSQS